MYAGCVTCAQFPSNFSDVGYLLLSKSTCSALMRKLHPLLMPSPPLRWHQDRWNSQSQGNSLFASSKWTWKEKNIFTLENKISPNFQWSIKMSVLVWLGLLWLQCCSAHSLFTCEPIQVHRCMGLSYNMTFFPNMMEHYDQDVAANKMEVSLLYKKNKTKAQSNMLSLVTNSKSIKQKKNWITNAPHPIYF